MDPMIVPDALRIPTVGIWLAVTAVVIAIVAGLRKSDRLSQEPPEVSPFIPYIGHVVGLLWYKNHYYTKLRSVGARGNFSIRNLMISRQCVRYPIYKLPVPGNQLYIVSSPELIASIEKQPKVVSFWHVEASATARLSGISQESAMKILDSLNDGTHGLMLKGLNAIHQIMVPSGAVNRMVLVASQTSAEAIRSTKTQNVDHRVDLWRWIRHEITMSTTEAVYGLGNPYRDPEIERCFW